MMRMTVQMLTAIRNNNNDVSITAAFDTTNATYVRGRFVRYPQGHPRHPERVPEQAPPREWL